MKKVLIIFFGLVFIIIISGCSKQNVVNTNTTSTSVSITDVSQHNTPQDCWTIVNGNVYNITDYVMSNQHPGRKTVNSMCGIDGTKVYNSLHIHSSNADSLLEQYRIK